MGEIREPIKKSSIEKKQRIIKMGFELMCSKGYHNVTCIDIAKYADVSTGIIYQYFVDKRDIFIEGVKDYSENIMHPMLNVLDNKKLDTNNLEDILNKMIDKFIKTHTMEKKAHEELMAMRHLDNEVSEIFLKQEVDMTNKIVSILENNGINIINLKEKVHIISSMIDNYSHEVVYHKHKEINYDAMKKELIKSIIFILK